MLNGWPWNYFVTWWFWWLLEELICMLYVEREELNGRVRAREAGVYSAVQGSPVPTGAHWPTCHPTTAAGCQWDSVQAVLKLQVFNNETQHLIRRVSVVHNVLWLSKVLTQNKIWKDLALFYKIIVIGLYLYLCPRICKKINRDTQSTLKRITYSVTLVFTH